jgi:hypothetical protein
MDNPDQEWMSITPEQLERWAGKASFKAGLKLASQSTPEVFREQAIRFPLFFPKRGLAPYRPLCGEGGSLNWPP